MYTADTLLVTLEVPVEICASTSPKESAFEVTVLEACV